MSTLHPLEAIALALDEDYKLKSTIIPLMFQDKECDALVTKYFSLIQVGENEFYLSFCLNTATLFDASLYTRFLTILLHEDVIPYHENFFEVSTSTMYFGKQAVEKSKEHINKSRGLHQCPICEKFLPLELFKDGSEFCVICNKITLEKVTFH